MGAILARATRTVSPQDGRSPPSCSENGVQCLPHAQGHTAPTSPATTLYLLLSDAHSRCLSPSGDPLWPLPHLLPTVPLNSNLLSCFQTVWPRFDSSGFIHCTPAQATSCPMSGRPPSSASRGFCFHVHCRVRDVGRGPGDRQQHSHYIYY